MSFPNLDSKSFSLNRNFLSIIVVIQQMRNFRDECLTSINNEAKSQRWVFFFSFSMSRMTVYYGRYITSVYIGRSTRVINESRSWRVCRLFNLSITVPILGILWNFIFSNESFLSTVNSFKCRTFTGNNLIHNNKTL